MEERKVVNNFHFTDLGTGTTMLLLLIGAGLAVLVASAITGHVVAIVILAVMASLVLIGFGIFVTLVIIAQNQKHQREMAKVERDREMDDTRENLAIMKMMAEAQLAQQRTQGESWKVTRGEVDTWRKMIAAGNTEAEASGFVFDDSAYAELE